MFVSHSPGMDEKVILNVCRHADFLACDFFYQGFLLRTLTTHGTAGKGRDYLLFHFTTSTRLRTFRHFFVNLHVKWLLHIFNLTACIYQTVTQWDLPPNFFVNLHVKWLLHIFNLTACIYQTVTQWDLPPNWIIIWVIDDVMFISVCLLVDDVMFIFVCLLNDLILGFWFDSGVSGFKGYLRYKNYSLS